MLYDRAEWLAEVDALKAAYDIRDVDSSLKSPQFTFGQWRIAIEHQRGFGSVVLRWSGPKQRSLLGHQGWLVCPPSDQRKNWHFRIYLTPTSLAELLGDIDAKPASVPDSESTLIEDLTSILEKKIDPTSKQALVSARVGQGRFRKQVLALWGNCCSVTGSVTLDAIRASHIKPWRQSSDQERLDPRNGLPLVANLDALFDAGLISFDSSGRLIVSSELSAEEQTIYGLGGESLAKNPVPVTAKYLAYHRDHVFRK